MLKGKIVTPRNYQERIVAYIEKLGDSDSFMAVDCVKETGVPYESVLSSLCIRCSRGELGRVSVDGAWLYAKKGDPKIMRVPPGLVAELVWETLQQAGAEESLLLREIARRIAVRRPDLHIDRPAIANDLKVWYRHGYMHPRGDRGRYSYRLTETARRLPERPVLLWHSPDLQPHPPQMV